MASGVIKTNSWKFIGQVGGGNTLDLPSNYNDLYVSAIYNVNNSYWRAYDWNLPSNAITNNLQHTQGYQISGSNDNYCVISTDNGKISMLAFTENGSDVRTSAVLTAYYR